MTTEKIEWSTIQMVSTNGKPIRQVTRLTIDGHVIDFTEKLTKAQMAKYESSRKARQIETQRNTESLWMNAD